jgi:hypothetical protein
MIFSTEQGHHPNQPKAQTRKKATIFFGEQPHLLNPVSTFSSSLCRTMLVFETQVLNL